METFTEISGSKFIWERLCFLLFRASFQQVETVTETSWNKQFVLVINSRS